MEFKRIYMIPLAILVSGALIMVLLISLKSEPPSKEKQIRSKLVEAEIVELKDIPSEIIGYGRLTSAQPVILYSEVAGNLLKGKIPFQPGQSFKKGELLLKIDDRQVKLDINSVKSDFLNALASVLPEIKVDFPEEFNVWQEYFNQCKFENKLDPLPEYSNPKIKLFLSRFNVYKLYFSVQNLEIRLEKHYFYVPFDGTIVSADLRSGSTARSGTRLGEIINLEDMEVEIPIATKDVQWIDRKKSVLLTSTEISGQWYGRIKRIGKNIDDRTQTVPIFISINQSAINQLLNGIFLKAIIPGEVIRDAVAVPRKALYNEEYVYLITDNKLNYQKVDVRRKETNHSIITGGIRDGDTLVIEVLQGVAPGMPAEAILSSTE